MNTISAINSRGSVAIGTVSINPLLSTVNGPDSLTIQPSDTIQGQMITATLHFDEMQMPVQDDIDIKNKLLNALAIELLSAKCIEFTKQQDVATNTMVVRARIFATPDNQVRLIRKATK